MIAFGALLLALVLVVLALAASDWPTDQDPATAIATIPTVKISPTMAFALSHRSKVDWSSGDILL